MKAVCSQERLTLAWDPCPTLTSSPSSRWPWVRPRPTTGTHRTAQHVPVHALETPSRRDPTSSRVLRHTPSSTPAAWRPTLKSITAKHHALVTLTLKQHARQSLRPSTERQVRRLCWLEGGAMMNCECCSGHHHICSSPMQHT
jgi:hypothetical protein